jgi:hemerythrin
MTLEHETVVLQINYIHAEKILHVEYDSNNSTTLFNTYLLRHCPMEDKKVFSLYDTQKSTIMRFLLWILVEHFVTTYFMPV